MLWVLKYVFQALILNTFKIAGLSTVRLKYIYIILVPEHPNPVPHTAKISKNDAFHCAVVWECFSLCPYSVVRSQKYLAILPAVPHRPGTAALSLCVGFLRPSQQHFRQQKASGAIPW